MSLHITVDREPEQNTIRSWVDRKYFRVHMYMKISYPSTRIAKFLCLLLQAILLSPNKLRPYFWSVFDYYVIRTFTDSEVNKLLRFVESFDSYFISALLNNSFERLPYQIIVIRLLLNELISVIYNWNWNTPFLGGFTVNNR